MGLTRSLQSGRKRLALARDDNVKCTITCHTLHLSSLTAPYFPVSRIHTHVHACTPIRTHLQIQSLPRCPSRDSSAGPVLDIIRKNNNWEIYDRSSSMVLIVLCEIKRLITTKELFFQLQSHTATNSVVCKANGRDREDFCI